MPQRLSFVTRICTLMSLVSICFFAPAGVCADSLADAIARLPELTGDLAKPAGGDWLVVPTTRKAGVYRSGPREICMANGLLRRTWRIAPAAATVGMEDLSTGRQLLRSVRPEAIVELEGAKYPVGGLTGQPIHNYLDPKWLEKMTATPGGFELESLETGATQPRFAWKKRREWMPQDMPWPPPGTSLVLHFRPPQGKLPGAAIDVHYEMYDGLPLLSKWIEVRNARQVAAAAERLHQRSAGGRRAGVDRRRHAPLGPAGVVRGYRLHVRRHVVVEP